MNAETGPRVQWHGGGETEPTENLYQPLIIILIIVYSRYFTFALAQ